MKSDIIYLTDFFTNFIDDNLQLLGASLNLIKTQSIIPASLSRIKLLKRNTGMREFSQFHNLSHTNYEQDDFSTFNVQNLNAFFTYIERRFENIWTIKIPQWIINSNDDIKETDVIVRGEE